MSLSGSILSAVGAAGQLFAGYGSVTLGPVQFFGLAKPKSMPIGGRQAITAHRLPGGGRVLDAMGPDNADIAWSGYLDGAQASITARALDKLRQSGQAVTLAWDVFSYQVLVSQFSCQTRHIPMSYSITCTVICDNSQVIASALTSFLLQITADLTQGNSSAALSAQSQQIVGNAVSLASIAVAVPGATALGSSAYASAAVATSAASSVIGSATASVGAALAPTSASLEALSASAPVGVDPTGMSNQLASAVSACGDLAQLAFSSGYVDRAAVNLQRASA